VAVRGDGASRVASVGGSVLQDRQPGVPGGARSGARTGGVGGGGVASALSRAAQSLRRESRSVVGGGPGVAGRALDRAAARAPRLRGCARVAVASRARSSQAARADRRTAAAAA